MATRKTELEVNVTGGGQTTAELKKIGDAGQQALQRIQNSAKPVSPALLAINAAAKETQGGIARLTSSLGPLQSVLVALGPGGLAASVGLGLGAAFLAAQKQAIGFASAIQDASDATGVHVETLQELRFAAGQVGVSQEEVDSALRSFSVNVGEAKNGTGALVGALKAHNSTLLENIRNTSSQEAALKLAFEAIAKETDATKQAALAADFFGAKLGAKLIPLVKDGAVGLEAMRQKARDLGLVLSGDLIGRADELGDKLDTLATVVKVNATAALLEFAGPIDQLADKMRRATPIVRGYFEAFFLSPAEIAASHKDLFALGTEIDKLEGKLREAKGGPGFVEDEGFFSGGPDVEELEKQLAAAKKLRAELLAIRAGTGEPVGPPKPSLATLRELEEQERAEKEAAARRLASQKSMAAEVQKLHEESMRAELDGIAKIEAARDQDIEHYREALKKGDLSHELFIQAKTDRERTAERDITAIREKEQKAREDATQKVLDGITETEREITLLSADEADRRKVQYDLETEARIEGWRRELADKKVSEAEITALMDRERANRAKLYDLQVADAKKAANSIKLEFSSVVGELTTGILQGTRDWEDGWDLLADAGIGALGKIIENKLSKFDPVMEHNFLVDLPGFVEEFASKALGTFGGLFKAILGDKSAFDSAFAGSGVAGAAGAAGGAYLGGRYGGTPGAIAGGIAGRVALPQLYSLATTGAFSAGTVGVLGPEIASRLVNTGFFHLAADSAGNIVLAPGGGVGAAVDVGSAGGAGGAGAGSGAGAYLGPALGVIGAGLGAYGLSQTWGQGGTRYGISGALAGAGGGAGTGAVIGSVVPGIGNVVGAIVGGLVGGLVGGIGSAFGAGASTDQLTRRAIQEAIRESAGFADLAPLSRSPEGLFGGEEFKNGLSIFERTEEIMQRFPAISGEALSAGQAFAFGLASAVDTPLGSNLLEASAIFTDLMARIGEAGLSGPDAISRIQQAAGELGIGLEAQQAGLREAFAAGHLSLEQLIDGLRQLDEQAASGFDFMAAAATGAFDRLSEKVQGDFRPIIEGVFRSLQESGIGSFANIGSATADQLDVLRGGLDALGANGRLVFEALMQSGISSVQELLAATPKQLQPFLEALRGLPPSALQDAITLAGGEVPAAADSSAVFEKMSTDGQLSFEKLRNASAEELEAIRAQIVAVGGDGATALEALSVGGISAFASLSEGGQQAFNEISNLSAEKLDKLKADLAAAGNDGAAIMEAFRNAGVANWEQFGAVGAEQINLLLLLLGEIPTEIATNWRLTINGEDRESPGGGPLGGWTIKDGKLFWEGATPPGGVPKLTGPEQQNVRDRILNPTPTAMGFHGWIDRPQIFLAGEAGRERVDITPASQMSRDSAAANDPEIKVLLRSIDARLARGPIASFTPVLDTPTAARINARVKLEQRIVGNRSMTAGTRGA